MFSPCKCSQKKSPFKYYGYYFLYAIGQICRVSLFQTQENGNDVPEAPVPG